MKKIILVLMLLFNFWITNADFEDFTEITENTTFDKIHWDWNILYLYEDIVINPFLDHIITKQTCSWNNCSYTSRYLVDGRVFNSSHNLYKNTNSILQDWTTDPDTNIKTKITVLENTYKSFNNYSKEPVQSVLVRNFYEIPISYDTTPPTCWDVELYNNQDLTGSFTYAWWWLNTTKYYTMKCGDPETNCKCDSNTWEWTSCEKYNWIVRTPWLPLWYKARPTASFYNNVMLLNSSCEWNLPSGVNNILYDQKGSSVKIILWNNIDFRSEYEINRDYLTWNWDWNLFYRIKTIPSIKAGEKKINFTITDEYLNNSTNWVSGIKSIDIKTFRVKDLIHNDLSPELELTSSWTYFSKNYTEYNPNWDIEVSDIKNINLDSEEFQKSWRYKIVTNVYDWAWNHTKVISYFDVYPAELDRNKSSISVDSTWDKFANNSDIYTYTLILKDKYNNPIYNKALTVNQESNLTGFKTLKTVDWSDALLENISWNTDNDWKIIFTLKSLMPGEFSQKFKIKMNKWWGDYTNNSDFQYISLWNFPQNNTFKKPVLWKLNLVWPWAIPEIWKWQKYVVELINTGSLALYSNWKLNISESSIKDTVNGHYWESFQILNDNFSNNLNTELSFSWRLDATDNLLTAPEVGMNDLEISYNLWGKNIKYKLDNSWIIRWCDLSSLGTSIIWNVQWDWKLDTIDNWNTKNVSDLSKWSLRAQIRKNAYLAIKNMTSWQVLNWIKYIEWDTTISGNNLWYETLVVKDGNIKITWDLNTNNDKLGIIILKNNYNVNTDYNNKWNIYISNNVEKFNAIIYADGALLSRDISWNKYSDWDLLKQLELIWSLFTRNTIGWAVKGSSNYTLPGWKETNDFELAENYDLNYLRKVPVSCSAGSTSNTYSFIITYNPTIQTNPPKLFGN